MNFLEIFQVLGGNVWLYGGAFVLVLSILVFVHEWGHYIVARMCGVRVETFSIGFGKELLGFNDKNGTRWKVAMIPLGGYVKLFGDVDPASTKTAEGVEEEEGEVRPFTEEERKEAFFAQSVAKRAAIVIAGPAINYIFAAIILTLLFAFHGQPVTPPVAAAVMEGSSADEYAFKAHDRIITIDGKSITTFEDIRREMMISLDVERHFVVERDGETIDLYATPERVSTRDRFGFPQSRGLLGLISPRHVVRIDSIQKIDGQEFEDKAALRAEITERMGESYSIEIKNGKKIETLHVHPLAEFNEFINEPDAEEHDLLFLSNVQSNVFIQYPIHIALLEAVEECWVITRGTMEALGQMVSGTRSATELGGVIRIGALAGDMAQRGLIALIMFSALLSINLGLINLFPVPMLDGGHLMFYIFEAIRGKPIPEQIQEYAFRVGFAFLIGVMVFTNLNDIIQLLT
ncbi:MAG: RIP metalloprotease RseP [Alphaproteobacteria bacterium]|nr:RIP metalloprotease RseP [Alphaproteobacteria bacterium]